MLPEVCDRLLRLLQFVASANDDTCRDLTFNGMARSCEGLVTISTSVTKDDRTVQLWDSFTAFGQAVMVAWESSDLTSFSPESAPLLQLASATTTSETFTSATSTTASPTTHVANASAPSQLTTNGLTAGAKAGIGAKVACGVLLGCALLDYILYKRKRRAKGDALTGESSSPKIINAEHERKVELGNEGHIHQMKSQGVIAEAVDTNTRCELEGNWQGHEITGLRSPT